MSRHLTAISAFVCLLGSILFLTRSSSPLTLPLTSSKDRPFSLAGFYQDVPYTSTWGSWLHPARVKGASIEKGWNILYHLGGNGPWVEKRDGVVQGGIGTPDGCLVEQVHMVGELEQPWEKMGSLD